VNFFETRMAASASAFASLIVIAAATELNNRSIRLSISSTSSSSSSSLNISSIVEIKAVSPLSLLITSDSNSFMFGPIVLVLIVVAVVVLVATSDTKSDSLGSAGVREDEKTKSGPMDSTAKATDVLELGVAVVMETPILLLSPAGYFRKVDTAADDNDDAVDKEKEDVIGGRAAKTGGSFLGTFGGTGLNSLDSCFTSSS
jgi:hypothetical protein